MRGPTWFDRFAGSASRMVSRGWFFAGCVLLVVVWAPSIAVIRSVDTWQLVINTVTTIVTFLLVALLQNEQERDQRETQRKLDALAKAQAEVLSHLGLRASEENDHPESARLLEAAAVLLELVEQENRKSAS